MKPGGLRPRTGLRRGVTFFSFLSFHVPFFGFLLTLARISGSHDWPLFWKWQARAVKLWVAGRDSKC
ncbi:MAG: hypothetical protein ABSF95_16000 [Verrucomicrobiota bacterium]|jgi:hypothetical protein